MNWVGHAYENRLVEIAISLKIFSSNMSYQRSGLVWVSMELALFRHEAIICHYKVTVCTQRDPYSGLFTA